MQLLRDIRRFIKNLFTINPTKPPFDEPTRADEMDIAVEKGKTRGSGPV